LNANEVINRTEGLRVEETRRLRDYEVHPLPVRASTLSRGNPLAVEASSLLMACTDWGM
jgi:hypothetical protein